MMRLFTRLRSKFILATLPGYLAQLNLLIKKKKNLLIKWYQLAHGTIYMWTENFPSKGKEATDKTLTFH